MSAVSLYIDSLTTPQELVATHRTTLKDRFNNTGSVYPSSHTLGGNRAYSGA